MLQIKAEWLRKPQTQTILTSLEAEGHQAFAVGGCVRNAILGIAASDVDIATSAAPGEVTRIFETEGHQVVPTGIDHGTVTVVVGGEPFEITTFRKDISTDGRRAIVEFSTCLKDDARRRDFTMNAIYSDAEGTLCDPLSGYEDTIARRVRFVGNAEARIREDYLRSLRFFRFYAQFGDPNLGPDPEGLAAIGANLDGLSGLSSERVGSEMLKLLSADDPAPALASMTAVGGLTCLLPGADARMVAPLVHIETILGLRPEPIRRLTAVGGEGQEIRLRLSRRDVRRRDLLRDSMQSDASAEELAWRHGRELALSAIALRFAATGTALPEGILASVELGQKAILPISARDLMPELSGERLGQALERATTAWIASGFELDRQALVAIALDEG